MICIENLDFFYGQNQALFDINLELPKNSITGLVGSNGAGKSTLMRCIAGLLVPSRGRVLLDGAPILDNPQHSYTKLGYLPDIFGLANNLTVLQYWTYSAHAKSVATQDISRAITWTADVLNLRHKIHAKISELSRGQRQRVGIGQVIIHKPKLLLLDEPASGLDPEARHELSCLFNALKEQGLTLLVSSHILSELDEYCTHILVLQDGRIRDYQPLGGRVDNANIEFMLRFEALNQDAIEVLSHAPHINHIRYLHDKHCAVVQMDVAPAYRTQLMAYCLEHRLSLIGAEVFKESLLDTYQKSLKITPQHKELS